MKYKSKKGTTINIPDGLSAKQIAAIKADADAGYGTRAQETANKLGKKKTTKTTDTTAVNTDGTINTDQANASIRTARNENLTDQYGNTRKVVTDPNTGEVTVIDEAGGTSRKFKDLAEAAASTFNGQTSRAQAEEATYNTLSRDFDRDEARDLEAAKQEMAERGIPYDPAAAQDPNTKNLYGRTIGGIGQSYKDLRAQAKERAVLAGNTAYATDAAARDSFIGAVTTGANTFGGQFQPYQSQSGGDTKDIQALSSAAFLQKYGVDKQTYIANKQLNKSGGGGGGSGGSGGGGGGFEIVG
jgi:hypothetical protein